MPTEMPTLAELGPCIFVKPAPSHGYGIVRHEGRTQVAHRVAWLESGRGIPDGFELDHICHNVALANEMCLGGSKCIHRSCVNLDHLEAVSPQENQLRGKRGLANRVKCKNGHVLAEVGVVIRKRYNGNTGERCKACYQRASCDSQKKFRERNLSANGL